MTMATKSTGKAVAEAGDGGPLADVGPVPHGFDGLGVRIGWEPPDKIFDRPIEELTCVINAMAAYHGDIVAAIAAGDALRTKAAGDANAAVIRQIGNTAVRMILAFGAVATGVSAVALAFHRPVIWLVAAPLGTLAAGTVTLSLRWIIARRLRSTAETLSPPEQAEKTDQP